MPEILFDASRATHAGAYKVGPDNHLLATYIIPRVRVPIAVDDHLPEQPIGTSSSPRDSDSDSGLTIRADSALRLSRDDAR